MNRPDAATAIELLSAAFPGVDFVVSPLRLSGGREGLQVSLRTRTGDSPSGRAVSRALRPAGTCKLESFRQGAWYVAVSA